MSIGTSSADNPKLETSSPPFVHTSESLKYAVTHVFLPPKLPDTNDYTPKSDHSLARAVCTAANAYSARICGTFEHAQWHHIIKMLDNLQASVQSEDMDSHRVIFQLRGMQIGDILPFFIRHQNAAIILTRRENFTLCESFVVYPNRFTTPEIVCSQTRSYPESAVEIPNVVFDDGDLQSRLANFLSHPHAIDPDFPLPHPGHPEYANALLNKALKTADATRVTIRAALVKHVRDPVSPSSKVIVPWHRSALWFFIRVTLQTSVNRYPGPASYKRFVLFFMCTLASDEKNTNLPSDLLHLMSSRIPQRLRKLVSTPDWLSEVALKTCVYLREILNAGWQQSIRLSPFRNPSQDELTRDTRISLPNAHEYIQNALQNPPHQYRRTPICRGHRIHGTIGDFLSSNGAFFDEAYDANSEATLYDVERSVEEGIDDWLACVTNVDEGCKQLQILMDQYVMKSYNLRTFEGDPDIMSIRLLTVIELYVALDKLVVREIPMLTDYSPGIPVSVLQRMHLRKATHLHRLSCAYLYLSARHSQSRPGWSVLSDEFTDGSFPVRYLAQFPHLLDTKLEARIGYDPPLDSRLHAAVVAFELKCPVCVRIWRAAALRILLDVYQRHAIDRSLLDAASEGHRKLLMDEPAFQWFFAHQKHQFKEPLPGVRIHLAYFYPPDSYSATLHYVAQHCPPNGDNLLLQATKCWKFWEPSSERIYGSGLKKYLGFTSHTSNDVLAAQADCPADLSIEEFIVFAHLCTGGGSLQWLNILQGLRCRTLNLRRHEVHLLLADAAFQVGPLDPNTGMWIWHQELQDPSFCMALLDELESLFGDVGTGSMDGVLMNSISLLLTRMLASSPSEDISHRAIVFLRSVRRKTFSWVHALSYDLEKAPINSERRKLLLDMAATCRSTFDIDSATLCKLFLSAEDVDAFLSCTFFIHALYSTVTPTPYSLRVHECHHHHSFTLEEILRNAIITDPSDYGIDLAVSRIFPSHWPGTQHWEQLLYPYAHWLMSVNHPFHPVDINLLNGLLVVDGQSLLGELPLMRFWDNPEFEKVFCDQGFFIVPSNLPGMEFMTLAITSKYKVHFSPRDDGFVIQAQGGQSNEILQLIPSRKLLLDLPPALVRDHVHWLNLSKSIIEIRPFKQLWDESSENWRIDCTFGQYHVYKGHRTLVDIRSPTWEMFSQCFQCLNDVHDNGKKNLSEGKEFFRNLLITTSAVQPMSVSDLSHLSVVLLNYALSFFINEMGELESHDFKDMVYDENQSIGTLFGLENLLVLRPKTYLAGTVLVPEAPVHRCVLIPNGYPALVPGNHRGHGENLFRINTSRRPYDESLYHTYSVDTEMGCLTGNGSLASTLFLAYLHATTGYHLPDPLTGQPGAQAALCLLQSGGCRSIMKSKFSLHRPIWSPTKDAQVNAAYKEIHNRYYWDLNSSVSDWQWHGKDPSELEEKHSYTEPGLPSTLPLPASSLRCIFDTGLPTQMELDYLMCNRPAPELLARSTLHTRSDSLETSSDNNRALDQLLSSLHADTPFQQQYLAHLGASARHVHVESRTTRHRMAREDLMEALQKHYVQCRANYVGSMDILKKSLGPTTDLRGRVLRQFGLWPPITANVLLCYLASATLVDIPSAWKECLTSLALLFLDLQRARRLLRLALDGLEGDSEFLRELENEGCDGWDATEYPDWLLIQIQGNFLIRRAQAETAMEIMSPRSGKNTVMQVDMGEGKSSVIIPIAAASLANGKQLVRVIVPKALTTRMLELLVARLGGLTNRPIYHLPFSRTPEYNNQGTVTSLEIDDLQRLMSQCMAERGILLVQPEHVMSLKLMSVEKQMHDNELLTALSTRKHHKSIYERVTTALSLRSGDLRVESMFRLPRQSRNFSSEKDNTQPDHDDEYSGDDHRALDSAGSKWLSLQKWLHSHARDILDESDEILHSRFQLAYTTGPQQHMDGYPDRWTITQQVLRLVKNHVESLSRYAPDSIKYESGPPGSFPRVHILRPSDVGPRLKSSIVEDVMAGQIPSLNFQDVHPALHDAIRSFISDEDVLQVPATAKRVEEYAQGSNQGHLWSGLLLLRGLLTSNILLFALAERRWLVDYGLDPQLRYSRHAHTMLAVPYRAKDMPAPNTQFGHPDVTIILTCLSYYYAGLSEEQLRASFEILLDQDDPTVEYILWIKDCESVPDSLRKLSDINLRSSDQWDNVVFPLFSKNQAAIDFYLSQVVFPKEAKEFPWKLPGSSWDLAEEREKLITGFSGTSDGRWLLPMSIAQRNLNHQKGTDARVLAYLLLPENNSYMVTIDSGKQWTTQAFLRVVATQLPEIRVLLDVGSQILGLSNYQVASAWLDISCESSGAIYFNDNDELMILTRNGKTQPLLSSSLSQQLDRYLVYLDHAHTRGTDIKLPIGSRAAVTLGPKITKDALVQGCMRMRKLGHGHSVMFFAPPGVDRSIRAVAGETDSNTQVTTVDILSWAIHETWTDIQQRTPYWAQQGMCHKSRYDTWSQFVGGKIMREKLTDAWLQPDTKSLVDLYAPYDTKHTSSTFSALLVHPDILQRCKDLGVLSLPTAQMEQEQEREVCRERERERELELPPRAEPALHSLHQDVVSFVRTGIVPPLHSGSAFQPVFTILGNSSAAICEADVWSPLILATADFCKTIKPETTVGRMDQYLRPVQWILSRRNRDGGQVLVLLSPFEASCLLPDIRESEHVYLHVYAPRTSQRMKPSDDLRFYSVPPLPSDWTPPWDLIDQLNVFAGQLYLRDYESYVRLCSFLDINDTTVRRNLFNIPGSFEEMKIMFSGSPLPSVMALLAIRTRGRPFAHTHMGKILQGQLLTKKDFEGPGLQSHVEPPQKHDHVRIDNDP